MDGKAKHARNLVAWIYGIVQFIGMIAAGAGAVMLFGPAWTLLVGGVLMFAVATVLEWI